MTSHEPGTVIVGVYEKSAGEITLNSVTSFNEIKFSPQSARRLAQLLELAADGVNVRSDGVFGKIPCGAVENGVPHTYRETIPEMAAEINRLREILSRAENANIGATKKAAEREAEIQRLTDALDKSQKEKIGWHLMAEGFRLDAKRYRAVREYADKLTAETEVGFVRSVVTARSKEQFDKWADELVRKGQETIVPSITKSFNGIEGLSGLTDEQKERIARLQLEEAQQAQAPEPFTVSDAGELGTSELLRRANERIGELERRIRGLAEFLSE
jgi:hypothetical protein